MGARKSIIRNNSESIVNVDLKDYVDEITNIDNNYKSNLNYKNQNESEIKLNSIINSEIMQINQILYHSDLVKASILSNDSNSTKCLLETIFLSDYGFVKNNKKTDILISKNNPSKFLLPGSSMHIPDQIVNSKFNSLKTSKEDNLIDNNTIFKVSISDNDDYYNENIEINIDEVVSIVNSLINSDILIYIGNKTRENYDYRLFEKLTTNKIIDNYIKQSKILFLGNLSFQKSLNNITYVKANLMESYEAKFLYLSKLIDVVDSGMIKKVLNPSKFLDNYDIRNNDNLSELLAKLSDSEIKFVLSRKDEILKNKYNDYYTDYKNEEEKISKKIKDDIESEKRGIEKEIKKLEKLNVDLEKKSQKYIDNEKEIYYQKRKLKDLDEKLPKIDNSYLVSNHHISELQSLSEFKNNYLLNMNMNFESKSGLENLEKSIKSELLNVLLNKIEIKKSILNYKLMLRESIHGRNEDNELKNFIFLSRNEVIEELNDTFEKLNQIILKEQVKVNIICVELEEGINYIKNDLNTLEYRKFTNFFNIFNFSGSFSQYYKKLDYINKKYSAFNLKIFEAVTSICNQCYPQIEEMRKKIVKIYIDILSELDKSKFKFINSNQNFDIAQVKCVIMNELRRIDLFILKIYKLFGNITFSFKKAEKFYLIPTVIGSLSSAFGVLYLYLNPSSLMRNVNILIGTGITSCFMFMLSFYMTKVFEDSNKDKFSENINLLSKYIKDVSNNIENDFRLSLQNCKDEFVKSSTYLLDIAIM